MTNGSLCTLSETRGRRTITNVQSTEDGSLLETTDKGGEEVEKDVIKSKKNKTSTDMLKYEDMNFDNE